MKIMKIMKTLAGTLAMISFTTVTTPAHALGNLSVEMRQAKSAVLAADPFRSGELEVVLRNTGDTAIEVMQEDLPYTAQKTGATGPKFDVTSNGEAAQFTGPFIDYFDKDVTTDVIAPGGSKVMRFNIYRGYAMKPGRNYEIAFRSPIRYLDRPSKMFRITRRLDLLPVMKSIRVAPLKMLTPANLDMRRLSSPQVTLSTPTHCAAEKVSEFNVAKSMSENLAYEALSHVGALYSYTPGSGGTIVGHFAGSPRYNTWFGSHGTPFDPVNMDPVNNEINAALFVIRYRISDDQSSPKSTMTVTCQCDSSDLLPPATPANTMAWVVQNGHYAIHACPLFWLAPNVPSVRDENSKVGTIIHETVHFSDLYWSGSQDHYPPTYTDTQNLAMTNRAQASKNPNTYKFFILNQAW